jgi:hypothetical protein
VMSSFTTEKLDITTKSSKDRSLELAPYWLLGLCC